MSAIIAQNDGVLENSVIPAMAFEFRANCNMALFVKSAWIQDNVQLASL